MFLQLAFVAALACAANGDAKYGHHYGPSAFPPPSGGPCPPHFRYVTQTQVQQVPVYTTQNVVVPTTIFQTRTEFETRFTTETQTMVVTQTQVLTEQVTQTETQTETATEQVTETETSTTVSLTPQFITRTAVQTRNVLRTEFVPRYVTQTVSQAHYVTVCPGKPAPNYW